MKSLFLTILFMGFLSFAQTAPTRVDFEDLNQTIQNSSVIIFGESHTAWTDNQHYPLMIQEIRRLDPSYDCLALELSASLQPEFEKIQGPADYREFFLQYLLQAPYFSDVYKAKTPAEQEQYLNIFVALNSPWLNASLHMKASGGKTFLMDDLSKLSSDVVASMGFRNEKMGGVVSAALANKECTKVIMINGGEHISTWHGLNLFDFIPDHKVTGFLLTDVYLPDTRATRIHIQERLK